MSIYIYIYLAFKKKSIHLNMFRPTDSLVKLKLCTCYISCTV